MRSMLFLLSSVLVGVGCLPRPEPPPEPMNLDAATRRPLLFAAAASFVKNCPIPEVLDGLNRFGDSGVLSIFDIDGFFVSEDGTSLGGNLRLAFAGAAYIEGTELTILPQSWSVHTLGPQLWDGDSCSAGEALVLGTPLNLHRQFVVPLSDDTYCVAAYFEIEQEIMGERCEGDRVGEMSAWTNALQALDPG